MENSEQKMYEEIKQNSINSEKQGASDAGSITEGDKAQINAEGCHSGTWMHLMDVHLLTKIKFGHELMCAEGNDAEWPSAACGSVRYASEMECLEEDDYNGMMAWWYGEKEDSRDGIYFCAPTDGDRREGIFGG